MTEFDKIAYRLNTMIKESDNHVEELKARSELEKMTQKDTIDCSITELGGWIVLFDRKTAKQLHATLSYVEMKKHVDRLIVNRYSKGIAQNVLSSEVDSQVEGDTE